MESVLAGFTTVVCAIAVGWWLARRGVFTEVSQRVLADTSFYVGSPALLFLLMYRANLGSIFSAPLAVTAVAAVFAILGGALMALVRGVREPGLVTIQALLAGYVNSANVGIPVAAYLLGDMAWVAPLLLVQVCLWQPLALTILDARSLRATGAGASVVAHLLAPLRNPLTVSAFAGIAAQLVGLRLPPVVLGPLELLGHLAVGTMLLAFGISLHGLRGNSTREGLWTVLLLTAIKAWAHPVAAYGLAMAFGLPPHAVMACTVLAALPSAQNIFVISVQYDTGVSIARNVIALTTVLSLPTLLVISLILRPAG